MWIYVDDVAVGWMIRLELEIFDQVIWLEIFDEVICLCHLRKYPLVFFNSSLLNMAIEIVDLPIENGGSFQFAM